MIDPNIKEIYSYVFSRYGIISCGSYEINLLAYNYTYCYWHELEYVLTKTTTKRVMNCRYNSDGWCDEWGGLVY